MDVFLHICCAPCSVACIPALRQEGARLTGFWYNPNIHPFTEYRSRRNALQEYAKAVDLPLIVKDTYGLRPFLQALEGDFAARCPKCYAMRLEATAQAAAENGFSAFSTTLTIRPYQNHELIQAAGEEAARKYGVRFLYRDFRPLFREGQAKARELGLYMQKYCGCIFSEEERYQKRPRAKG